MFKRIEFISTIRMAILPLAAASMLIASSAQAQWVLIDDFQGLAQGTLVEGTTGPGATWTGTATSVATAEEDPDCAQNLAMLQTGAPGNTQLRAAFTDATTNIADGATGTLFYRIRVPVAADGTTDHVIGLTDNPDITNFNFKSGIRNIVPNGINQFDARIGVPGYQAVSNLADNTWYSVWMVTRNTSPGGNYDLYMQSDTDPAFATQTRLATAPGGLNTDPQDVFPYRIDVASEIVNVYFRNANNVGGVAGNDIYIDDIYINPSASDLTTPSGVGICPTDVLKGDVDTDGDVDFNDIPAFIAVLQSGAIQAEADCDCNGSINFDDIPAFIDILQNQ